MKRRIHNVINSNLDMIRFLYIDKNMSMQDIVRLHFNGDPEYYRCALRVLKKAGIVKPRRAVLKAVNKKNSIALKSKISQ